MLKFSLHCGGRGLFVQAPLLDVAVAISMANRCVLRSKFRPAPIPASFRLAGVAGLITALPATASAEADAFSRSLGRCRRCCT